MTDFYYKSKLCSILLIILLVLAGFIIIFNMDSETNSVFAASTWEQTSDKHFGNGTMNNLTIVGSGADAELEIDLSDLHHWIDKIPGNSPGNIAYHDLATVFTDDKAVLFGGYSNPPKDETWEYDYSANTWSQKTPTIKPRGRYANEMAGIYGHKKVLLYGGYTWTGGQTYFSDTWIYDSSTGTWTDHNLSYSPSGRQATGMAPIYNDDKVVLFGGMTTWTNYLNDTWVFDLSSNSWTIQNPIGSVPSARAYPAMASIQGTDKVLLFGGMTSWSNVVGDTWIYDLSDNKWTLLSPPGPRPIARSYHNIASIYNSDRVVLFGGSTSWTAGQMGDTWVFDLSDNAWTQILPRDINDPNLEPDARNLYGLAMIDRRDQVVLYGGMASWNNYRTDTWVYKDRLPPRNGTYISAPFDTGSGSDYIRISWGASTPENTSIELQIRTASNKTKLGTKPFVGPDGAKNSFYTSTQTDIWSGHDGDQWLQYIVYFNITVVVESPSLDYVLIDYNCLPNTIVISPTDGTLLTNNKPTFKWTFEDKDSEQNAFQVIIDDNNTFTSIDFDSGEQNTDLEQWDFPSGTGYSEIPDGLWYWQVRTKDSDNAWTEFSEPRKLWIDTQLPTSAPEYPANEGFYNELLTIIGVANDGLKGSGINKIEIAINRLSDNNYWDGTKWAPLASWLTANGTENWYYDSSEIKWNSGTKYSVQSRAIDEASNIEVPGLKNVFTIDQDSPESIIETPADNTWINKLNLISGSSTDLKGAGVKKVTICIQCSKDSQSFDGGPKEGEFWSGSDWTAQPFWFATSGTEQWSINASNIPFTTGDHYTIQSQAIDKTDNVEVPGPGITFMYDNKPPENLQIFINNDDEYTSATSVILSLSAEDVGSGVAQMRFSTDNAVWSNWETYNTSRDYELYAADGKKTIFYQVKDFTGNEAKSIFDTITLDSTPPEDLSIIIEENSKYANSKRIKLDLKATDRLSGVSETSFSYDGIKWLSWEPFAQVRYIDIPSNIQDGDLKVYFKVKDQVDNVATPIYDSIVLDTKDPYALSMVINNGAAETNSTTVTLELQALDNTSGVKEISFSSDGNTWSDWEEFVKTKSYTLSVGNGQKTIYYRVRDHAGNIAEPIAKNIKLNVTSSKEKEPSGKASGDGLEFWLILVIVIVVILVLVIMALLMVIRRKRRAEEERATAGAVTIRPGGLAGPMIGVGAYGGTSPTQFPQLAKSTQTAQPTVQAQASPAVIPQPLPALPPARIPTTTTPTTTPTPTVGPSTPSPTIAQPTQTPTISTTPPQKLAPTKPTPAPTPTPTPPTPTPIQLQVTPTVKPTTTSPPVHLPDTAKPSTPTTQTTPTVKTEQPNQKNQE